MESNEQRGTGIKNFTENVKSNRVKWSTLKGGPVFSKLSVPFELSRSIQFQTEISGNFHYLVPRSRSILTGRERSRFHINSPTF